MTVTANNDPFQKSDASSEAIGRRLRAARELIDPKQSDFAKRMGISKTTYNSQETRGAPSIDILKFLYEYKKIDPSFIYFGETAFLPEIVRKELEKALSGHD